jgi:hypothetical protein
MPRDALEHAQRSVTLSSEMSEPGLPGLARFATGRARFLGGDFTAAEDDLELSVSAREEAADHAAAAESRIQLGVVQNTLGDLPAAERSVHDALDQMARVATLANSAGTARPRVSRWRHRWTLASAALVLGRLRLDHGDGVRARRHLSSAFHTAEAIAAREMALEARVELAALQAALATPTLSPESLHGVVGELRAVLDAALALELRPLACRARIELGSILCSAATVESSNPAQAREAAVLGRDALVQARSVGLKLQTSGARRVLAMALAKLGYWPTAEREFELALTELEQIGARVELVRTLIAYADAEASYSPTSRVAEVRARVTRAAELAEAIGLPRDRLAAGRVLATVGA